MSNTPAGWYPQGDGRQRYWDGDQWTEHFAPGSKVTSPTGEAAATSPSAAPRPARPWFKKKRFIIPAGIVGLIVFGSAIGAASEGSNEPSQVAAGSASSSTAASAEPAVEEKTSSPTPTATEKATPKPTPTKAKPAPTKAEPAVTRAQENALRSAENYLGFKGFSKKGLIEQLSSEYGDGFEKADAAWAVEHLDVNWNEQAVRAAESYLDFKGFSRQGLIEQLSSEYGDQFTVKQATYAAKKVGL